MNGIGWLTVYVFAPLAGGLLGGVVYRVFFRPAYRQGAATEKSAVEPDQGAGAGG